jgi:hypothetical protein
MKVAPWLDIEEFKKYMIPKAHDYFNGLGPDEEGKFEEYLNGKVPVIPDIGLIKTTVLTIFRNKYSSFFEDAKWRHAEVEIIRYFFHKDYWMIGDSY